MRCVTCKKGNIRRALVQVERNVAGHRFTAKVKGHACANCKETYVDGPELQRFEVAVARALAEAAEQSESAIKFMRKAIGVRVPPGLARMRGGSLSSCCSPCEDAAD